ncbi:uncharacterized protein Z520_05993 [Fonsecaea multimorphosa CBS 102226]|uniref:Uncharacterized protein n=1 Tax=Fonsecaea multimorphosa CBS 102226 TaxID=1442371 RepID=A0A0D2JYS6_9EURO|nr:uncharacterized protein Z520_05993 [Fonsecaea multimorphosa CBS 102226]KIX98692.1 hypothetical protein Z520_05993 [Fonsecaea multimorphosa CBS 102226]OAL24876.1 hypothetical protein AYO22_05665 [Fonsecaea multimorphosa]
MSRPEPPEPTSTGSPLFASSSSQGATSSHVLPSSRPQEQDTATSVLRDISRAPNVSRDNEGGERPWFGSPSREIPFAHMRVHFEDFAKQLRLHRHHEYRKRMLYHQRDGLRNAIALSGRLQRVGSWVHDGLVQISQQSDPSGFTRVHQHMQDLVTLCHSQWNYEIHALDSTSTVASKTPVKESFFARLSPAIQEDCLELVQTLRSNPRFLVERFKAMNPEQVKGLSTSPKFKKLPESVLESLSQNRGRESQRRRPRSSFREFEDDTQLIRSKAYSKELEDYASSFERSNPLSFLVHNIYGSTQDVLNNESQLRLYTWSTICANLMLESGPTFDAIIGEVLSVFAHLYEWQIKDRLEMFLMGSLQRGAFLYNSLESAAAAPRTDFGPLDPSNTPQAQAFFDAEVKELFQILCCDGGIPTGALCLGRAIIGKLPTVESQSAFRGHFFFRWFLQDFLRIAISFPEDEKMLLQFHINSRARFHLLHRLWDRAVARATETFSPMTAQHVDHDIQNCVNGIIGRISADTHCSDPYQSEAPSETIVEPTGLSYTSICAADIAHLLEKLRPQVLHTSSPFGPFLSSSQTTFNMQYSRAISKFERLCRRILDVIEPGHSSKNVHPRQENWALLLVSETGKVSIASTGLSMEKSVIIEGLGELDPAEGAALRLADQPTILHNRQFADHVPTKGTENLSLTGMFAAQANVSLIKTDSITSMYWHEALKYLRTYYPLTVLTGDDTKVLGPLTHKLMGCRQGLENECLLVEQEVAGLAASYTLAREDISKALGWLDRLRIKLWYESNVLTSNVYDNARNIAVALNNMALPPIQRFAPAQEPTALLELSRPGASATSASSIFDQPRIDTMTILKAPVEHGGPRKLSDPQIEKTKKWLERNHVENFCRGEERIHRFCMEVKLVTRKLVGETLADSPVLWSSELFAREKSLYDIHAVFGGLPSTRPPSVMSEPLSSTSFPIRAAFLGSRTSIYGGSSRLGKDGLGSDMASFISSPGRATTSTTLESSIWSPAQSNSRSVTSASVQSRPASTFEDVALSRPIDRSQEKASFLESLRQDLTSLLLSDLGCPVWSCGSESDTWMTAAWQTPGIVDRLLHRTVLAQLLPPQSRTRGPTKISHSESPRKQKGRSQSAAPLPRTPAKHNSTDGPESLKTLLTNGNGELNTSSFPYLTAFDDVLGRVRDHTDPILKLRAIRDFRSLSQAFQQSHQEVILKANSAGQDVESQDPTRRRSLDPNVLSKNLNRQQRQAKSRTPGVVETSAGENATVQFLKDLLFVLRPKTIFRDLQYIAAFVSSETLDDTELGPAFLHVGLAALAWKDEVCRGMVDVADRIVAKDAIKRNVSSGPRREPSVLKAMEYWIIGAQEGNAIAQRELASLYLTHPDVPPIVSLPLAMSSEIFKREMRWKEEEDEEEGWRRNSQALCLALHWMQEAAKNGDAVARTKLQEREAGRSIR